jgi:hypothetical protein
MTPPPPDEQPHPTEPTAATQPGAAPQHVYPPYPPGFAPVPRPPRMPWINPARRAHVAGASVVAALALLGAGVGIGWAAAPGGHREAPYRMEFRPGYYLPGMGGYLPHRFHWPVPPAPVPAGTPSPTTTK